MNAKGDWTEQMGDPFQSETGSEKSYKAWRKAKSGIPKSLMICPAAGSNEITHFIAYFQNIDAELSPDGKQLRLLCTLSNKIIFIEGTGLEEIALAVTEKKAVSLHVHDPSQGPSKESCVIARMAVENQGLGRP